MSYNYPYGTVPQQSFNGAQVNPYGYASPVANANPFSALVLAHGMRKAFSGSSSSDPDVSVVTYDSYMDDSEFSTKTLGISKIDLETFGKPLGLKYKDCGVVIPLPSKKAVCNTIEKQIKAATGNADLSEKRKTEIMRMISNNLAEDFFKRQCGYGADLDPSKCSSLPGATSTTGGFIPGKIAGVDESIRRVNGSP